MSLADEVVELLKANGPMEVEFVRNRLCIASKARLDAALFLATHEGRIEACNGGEGSRAFRIPGDTRAPLAGDVIGLWRQRRRASA
jgi:hypothetical protein